MLLSCEPRELTFEQQPAAGGGAAVREICLRSTCSATVAFKVKTTRPQLFAVSPVVGLLRRGEVATISVSLKGVADAEDRAVPFMVMATRCGGEEVPESRAVTKALATWEAAERAAIEQHKLRARISAPPTAAAAATAAPRLAGEAGLQVEPRTLQMNASVALSLGKLTLRRPVAPGAGEAVVLWKFRTTQPGVFAVRPVVGVFREGAAERQTVTVTRRADGARTERGTAPRLKLSSVSLGAGYCRCPGASAAAAAATAASSGTEGATALWRLVDGTPLLAASIVHQFVDICVSSGSRRAAQEPRPEGTAEAAPARAGSGSSVVPVAPAESPPHVEQSAEEWAAEMHARARRAGSGARAVPEYFLDPILGSVFVDPVTTDAGNTYERASIERWLAAGKRTDPLTVSPALPCAARPPPWVLLFLLIAVPRSPSQLCRRTRCWRRRGSCRTTCCARRSRCGGRRPHRPRRAQPRPRRPPVATQAARAGGSGSRTAPTPRRPRLRAAKQIHEHVRLAARLRVAAAAGAQRNPASGFFEFK